MDILKVKAFPLLTLSYYTGNKVKETVLSGTRMSLAAALLLAVLVLLEEGQGLLDGGEARDYIDSSTEPLLQCHHQKCRYKGLYISDDHERYFYEVDGKEIFIEKENSSYLPFMICCYGASVLESKALPRAETVVRAPYVTILDCPPPSSSSFNDTLTALNVELERNLSPSVLKKPFLILEGIPPQPQLNEKHFAGLENLVQLSISANTDARAGPMSGFLTYLHRLDNLKITDLSLPAGELERLPSSIRFLDLKRVDVERLPETLCSSYVLEFLTVESRVNFQMQCLGPSLTQLSISSPATSLHLHDLAALFLLNLKHWTETHPTQLKRCNKLSILQLIAPAIRTLPPGWLAKCSSLKIFELNYATNLTTLPKHFLLNASALLSLSFKQGALETLPDGLLRDAPNLNIFELAGNRLLSISSSMFLPGQQLSMLNLSSNDLDGGALKALAPLKELNTLDLGYNKRLADVCDKTGISPISELINLRVLSLKGTSVTHICKDWRENMTVLDTLDLSLTMVSELVYEDLQFTRVYEDSSLLILGAPLAAVMITRNQFEILTGSYWVTKGVHLKIDAELTCDCRMYWTRRLLEGSPQAFARVENLRCVSGKDLREMPPEDMTCTAPRECKAFKELPTACECDWVPRDDGGIVRVRCERVGLDRVPHLASWIPDKSKEARLRYQLKLANNYITDLYADDIQNYIEVLDLRNNSLRRVNDKTADKISNFGGALWIAGNPLECDCHATPLLLALHSLVSKHTDLSNATCRDGSSLQTASLLPCSTFVVPVVVGLALMLTVTLVVICLASPQRRFFAKALLHRWGCLWRAKEPEEDEARTYDVFLTFSHDDEMVACELVKRLEHSYRLCVHSRDWAPGRLISDQIAESVTQSRRTLALVSAHFLASSWAQVEFREAHATSLRDSSHRLIVVMLEEPHKLALDAQLKHYINTNTYLRWGDPWFWDKLKVALPRDSNLTVLQDLELTPLPCSSAGLNLLTLPSTIRLSSSLETVSSGHMEHLTAK